MAEPSFHYITDIPVVAQPDAATQAHMRMALFTAMAADAPFPVSLLSYLPRSIPQKRSIRVTDTPFTVSKRPALGTKVYYVLKNIGYGKYFQNTDVTNSGTSCLQEAVREASIPSLLHRFSEYVTRRRNSGSHHFTLVRVEETAGVEVRRLLSQRDGCREDEQIRFAVFGTSGGQYLTAAGISPLLQEGTGFFTGESDLNKAYLYSDVNECMTMVRLGGTMGRGNREGRRIAVSTSAPTVTETVLA